MKTSGVEAALAEMDFDIADNDSGMKKLPVSKPAAFVCEPEATLAVDELEAELDGKDIGMFDTYTTSNSDGRWYLNFEVFTEDFNRVLVKMWPDAVRVYPREDGPTLGELAQITSAIESAFETSLTHDPIDE